MIDWVKRKPGGEKLQYTRAFSQHGILVGKSGAMHVDGIAETAIPLSASDVGALFHQLEDDGFALPSADGWVLPWDSVYNLIEHSDYATGWPLLNVPPVKHYSPTLKSDNSLTDTSFSISFADWRDESGRRIDTFQLTGALIRQGAEIAIVPRAAWQLVRAVVDFLNRDDSKRNADAHRRAWSEIRSLAIAADARLDSFLLRTVILTPERLEIGLTKSEVSGTKIIEIAPGFFGAPKKWLEVFDSLRGVPNRYDIPTTEGIVQVLILPEVKTVLDQIKRLPGRRVAGSRAEAFIVNPFAALGEDASSRPRPGSI